MKLEVFWTRMAVNKLFAFMEHSRSMEGSIAASELFNGLVDQTLDLQHNGHSGEAETRLTDLPQNFRYVMYKNFKILYWINEEKNRIDIASVFETRQNQEELKDF